MQNKRTRLLRLVLGLTIAGTLYGSGCLPDGTVQFVRDYNPCGTILNCDPVAYEFLTSGYEGPGVNVDIDPACTYPPYCNVYNPGSDPFSP
ncbi:MAG: hypothetical protein ABIG44_01100 [Planctomycetota bacterium]